LSAARQPDQRRRTRTLHLLLLQARLEPGDHRVERQREDHDRDADEAVEAEQLVQADEGDADLELRSVSAVDARQTHDTRVGDQAVRAQVLHARRIRRHQVDAAVSDDL